MNSIGSGPLLNNRVTGSSPSYKPAAPSTGTPSKFGYKLKTGWNNFKDSISDGWESQKEQWADDIAAFGNSENSFGMDQFTQIIDTGAQLANNAMGLAQIDNTTNYQTQIDQLRGIGNQSYNDFDAIEQDYQQVSNLMPDINYGSVRGISELGEFGTILDSGLEGASAGFTIGGPWGAAAGAIIGAGTGLIGALAGDSKASLETRRLRNEADEARFRAQQNLALRREELRDTRFSQGFMNAASKGGQLERRTQSIQDFAKRALGTPRRKDEASSFRVIRQACDGGVRIKIKR